MKTLALYKNFFLLISVVFLGRCSWFMTMPFMAVYFSHYLHASPIAIGAVIGAGLLSSCIAGLFIGGLVDRFSNRLLLFVGAIFSAAIFLLFATPLSLIGYGILNIFLGIFRSLIDTASQSYIMELLPTEKRSMGLNLRYALINISATIGPLLGGLFINYSAPALFCTAAAIYFVSALILLILPKSPHKSAQKDIWQNLQTTTKLLFRDQAAKIILFTEMIACIGFAQVETTLPQIMALRIADHYIYFYSWLLAINAILVVSLQMVVNNLFQSLARKYTTLIFSALLTLSFVLFGFAYNVPLFFCAMVIFTLAEIVGVNFYNNIINNASSDSNRGAYLGCLSFGLIGYPIGTFFGGILLKHFGSEILFLCAAAASIATGIYLQCAKNI